MTTYSKRKEQYSVPTMEMFEVNCEGVFCISLNPGESEDGTQGDDL